MSTNPVRKPFKASWQTHFKRKPKEDRTFDGIVFHSMQEMRTYRNLMQMVEDGEVKDVTRQTRWKLILPDGTPVKTPTGRTMVYTDDFQWTDCKTGSRVIADCKGFMDKSAAMRIAIFEAIYKKKVLILKK